jgi:hypothetical protein
MKLLPDLEQDDLQAFSNEEVNISEITYTVNGFKGPENGDEKIPKNGCKTTRECGFKDMTEADISAVTE